MPRRRGLPFIWIGALAGVISILAFAAVHAVMIGDIWFFIWPMVVAGAVTGSCLAWSFRVVADRPTLGGWLRYNLTHVGLLFVLGVVSLVVFEPTTRFESLFGTGGLEVADRLIGEAMPLTAGFAVGAAAVVTLGFGRRWWHFGPVLLATAFVVTFLGLNVSILGLIDLPTSSAYVVAEFFFLIVVIVAVYAGVCAALARQPLRNPGDGSGNGADRWKSEDQDPGAASVPAWIGRSPP